MKRKSTRRLATVFLSLFLVCICLATVFAFPVSAAADSNSDYVYKTDYTTKDKKPTYTATLNENNRLLKELNKKENKVLNKVKNQGVDWINTTDSLIKTINNDEADVADWADVGVDLLTSIAGIWGFDGLVETVFGKIESTLSSGKEPLSEVQVLSDDMMQQCNGMNDHLYEIEELLASLSNQVTDSANSILNGTQSQINNLESKLILREFMMSGDAGFSYLDYSNYLYGTNSLYTTSTEAYYLRLIEAIQEQKSDEKIQACYNRLFDSLYNNIGAFNQYYYGEVIGMENKSVAMHYYDYVSYNPNLLSEGTTAEYEALMFALDLYTTYVYSYELLEMCYSYQLLQMHLGNIDEYEYNEGKAPVTESSLRNDYAKMEQALIKAEEQVVEDIAYILSMEDSYIVVDERGDIHSIGNYGESFGNIANGQVIYLNVVPDEICDLFELNTDNFKYYVNDTEYRGENKGIVDSDEIYSDSFVVSVTYGNTKLYSIEFAKIDNTLIEEFSGGSGTVDDPYLISNAMQFYMVADDLNACYQLISDITLTGMHSPIGTEKKPFNGTFDGNGYSITNLVVESLAYDNTNITMTPTTGVFGTIGGDGIVENLTAKALQVTSDHQKDAIYPENDISYYYVGGIAGLNKGIIRNCHIEGTYNEETEITSPSLITVNRLKSCDDSRTIIINVGGIAGSNSGIIEYCSTDNLSITVDSYLYYYNESIHENEHSLYLGGIAAVTSNAIRYCRVSENTTISAYAKSIADSEDREKPILSVYVGGIIADDSAKLLISNVYSSCNILKCRGEVYNEGKKWGEHRYSWDNVSLKQGLYYPTFFPLSASEKIDDFEMHFYESEYQKIFNENYQEKCDKKYKQEGSRQLNNDEYQAIIDESKVETKQALIEKKNKANLDAMTTLSGKVLSSYTDTAFVPNDDNLDISIELTDNICEINAKYLNEYFNKLIDEENEVKNIKFVDASGNAVDATVVGYYGFSTYHESATAQTITVKVFFYVNDTLMSDDVTLVIKANELVDWTIEGFVDTTFDKGISSSMCLDEIFEHGFKIVYIYSNGQREEFTINNANRSTVDIYNLITSEYGKKTITIYHNEQPNVGKLLKFEQTIEFDCHHTNSDFILDGTVDADCKFLGYEIWKCNKDGEGCGKVIHKNYVKGEHTYVVKSGQAATCHEAGYTQEVSCSVCGEVFESSEWIQALPHNYVSSSESGYKANGLYPAAEYHYCTNGDHYEAHQYTVSEYVDENGTLVYLYSCFCGYENPVPDYNIKTKENGEKPVVVVTNGHVLNVGDEVVVYVQIINNPGFKGATFGIRYDNGLELISADESMIVPQQLKVRNEVYNGYNFLWAEGDGNKTTEDGYLLKLTFKYVDETEGEQHISVVYGMSNGSEGGFCTLDDGYHMFMTQSGTISVVEHLPGDVNNDEVVDIMDATYIAWSIVGKEDENGNKIQVNARYADVNLDGKIDLLDVLAILQSISGRYGTSLLSSDYKLFFDLNGFICDDVEESVMVEFYDKNGNRTKWSENVDFVKYEALMKQLGYTFVGWYTRMDCTCCTCIDPKCPCKNSCIANEDCVCEENCVRNLNCKHLIKATDFITYDKYQGNQTLYARWEKNKIIFDMGGADCEQFDEITYSKAEHENEQVTLDKPVWSYDIDYIVDGAYYDNGRIYKDFLGWKDESGNFVTMIDLSKENLGTIKLTAVWSEYKWVTPDKTETGYENITEWFVDSYLKTKITDLNGKDVVSSIVNNGCEIYSKRIATKYTITYNNTQNVVNNNSTQYYITDTVSLSDLSDYTGYEFDCWLDENGNKITSIAKGTTGDITLTAKWKAKVYTITVQGMDVNPSNQTDSNRNPKYNSKSFGTLYYTYGDDAHEQGFYVDAALANKLTTNHFAEYCVNTQGKTNFNFGGLFTSIITNNGHSYASYANNSRVLSSNFTLINAPILSEDSRAGTLYVLLAPKQYTITLNANTSSQVALVTTNSFTTSTKAYYNEKPTNIATMPQSDYYNPIAFATQSGTEYFTNTGVSKRYYDISGNTTMYCSWSQKYEGTYIYDTSSLKNIANNKSGTYHIITSFTVSEQWTPISTFSGVIDGHNNTISNLKVVSSNSQVGFIVSCSGTISNVVFENANISGEITGNNIYVGTIAAILTSTGKISNCQIKACSISAKAYDNDNTEGSCRYTIAGGVVGQSSGTIQNCTVKTSSIYGFAKKHDKGYCTGWDEAAYVYVGGVVGEFYAGTVKNNLVESLNKLEGNAEYRENYWYAFQDSKSYSRICLGGVIGRQNGASLTQTGNSCYVSASNFKSSFNSYNNMDAVSPVEESKKGNVVGYVD